MKIALAQMEVIPGRMDKNVRKMVNMIALARQQVVAILPYALSLAAGAMVYVVVGGSNSINSA